MNLEILSFQEAPVRIAMKDGSPWFCASDVCRVLSIENARHAVASFTPDEKGVVSSDTLGGKQSMTFVSEPGLYRLIFRSKKPCAAKFQAWVFREVLPAIRKTGKYAVSAKVSAAPAKPVTAMTLLEYVREKGLGYGQALKLGREARVASNALGARRTWSDDSAISFRAFDVDFLDWVQAAIPPAALSLGEALSDDFRKVVEAWRADGGPRRDFRGLCRIARACGAFSDWCCYEMTGQQKSAFGKFLLSQNGRTISGFRFDVIGRNRQRHYALAELHQQLHQCNTETL